MSARQSIEIPGLSHLTGIPVATRVGPLLVSSVIAPFDAGTRNVPDDVDTQVANIFAHMSAILDKAGGTWDDVAKLEFFAPSGTRKAIDAPYLKAFPDETSRPARHTHKSDLPMITASMLAYLSN